MDIEAIRQEEERLAAEKMKISKLKSDKEKPISDSSKKQSRPKEKGIVIGEINYSDINMLGPKWGIIKLEGGVE